MSDVHLQCLQGRPAPQPIVEGWRALVALPEGAGAEVLDLALARFHAPDDPASAALRVQAADRHGVEVADLEAAVNACGWLLEQAVALNLPLASVREDVTALCGDAPAAGLPLIQRYEGLSAQLRHLVVRRTLSDHGKILVALDWRVDSVSASNRGVDLATDVVYLTLRYVEADQPGRVTLQLTSEALRDLRGFLDRFDAAR